MPQNKKNINQVEAECRQGFQPFVIRIGFEPMTLSLSDEELVHFKFHKEVNPDGTVKYLKGAFRILIPKEGDFSRMEIWYRDETRHILQPISVHNLQNHFYEMTKVYLNDESFD